MSNQKLSKSQVHLRAATDSDIPFIFNSWLKSYKQSAFAKYISGPVYFDLHHKTIENLLKRGTVRVAVNPVDHNQIYGYLIYELIQGTAVIHYAYVKDSFRKLGVLTILLEDAQLPDAFFFSHSTVLAAVIIPKLSQKVVYNPYLAFTESKV